MQARLSQKSLKSLLRILNEAGVTAYKADGVTIVLSGTTKFPALPEDVQSNIMEDFQEDEPEDDRPLTERIWEANQPTKDED